MAESVTMALICGWIGMVLFLVASTLTFLSLRQTSIRQTTVEPIGRRWRNAVYRGLFVAMTFRTIELLIIIVSANRFAASTSDFVSVLTSSMWSTLHWVPSFVMLTVYSFLLLFSAQLCHSFWGISASWLSRICLLLNLVLYIAGITLAALAHGSNSGHQIWHACDILLASYYALALVALVYYGCYVTKFFRWRSPSWEPNEQSSLTGPRNNDVSQRILWTYIVCGCVFFTQCCLHIALGANIFAGDDPSDEITFVMYSSVVLLFTEWLPCMIILKLLQQPRL